MHGKYAMGVRRMFPLLFSRPWTRSMSRAQAHLNDLDAAQDESGNDNDSSAQSSEGSSISQTISSVGPS